MPKKETEPGFNREEWLSKARERIMQQPWGTGVIWNNGTLFIELVRVGESEDVMIRVRTANVRNSIKLTRKEHVDALMELARAIAENDRNVRDKLEAVREILRTAGRRQVVPGPLYSAPPGGPAPATGPSFVGLGIKGVRPSPEGQL